MHKRIKIYFSEREGCTTGLLKFSLDLNLYPCLLIKSRLLEKKKEKLSPFSPIAPLEAVDCGELLFCSLSYSKNFFLVAFGLGCYIFLEGEAGNPFVV